MMMSHYHHRRMLPPGNTRKRKLADEADKPIEPKNTNRLLAGYLAHEFLTRGTLFGQKYEPESGEISAVVDPKKSQPKQLVQAAEPSRDLVRKKVQKEQDSYGEVASIMKTDGIHIKGIVNPTQLSRWIHM
ncbi:hypothetical protein HN51_028618 [Arachis hypogaea]|uniref:Uncharacterized protein n=2 Tax=Arachis TaxID=3817 RepID=A0A445BI20_ARAHY|nr:uncharacterized protein LOC107466252 [Arachis duranensis]XP_025619635.1 uncharacterized protein LOC112711245 [Arachis hypogaea]XP_057732334.1 uncharacterized protein LOC130947644 [Arachis stenosperma]RYR38323.1 hypothetical protein Ahy_A09g043342 [Arachis hypogaea]